MAKERGHPLLALLVSQKNKDVLTLLIPTLLALPLALADQSLLDYRFDEA
jgi:hypothetical protein